MHVWTKTEKSFIEFRPGDLDAFVLGEIGDRVVTAETVAVSSLAKLLHALLPKDSVLVELALTAAHSRLMRQRVGNIYKWLGDDVTHLSLTDEDVREIVRLRDQVLRWVRGFDVGIASPAVLMAAWAAVDYGW